VNVRAEAPPRTSGTAAMAGLARVRRASLAALMLVVAEYVIGMYINLYATIPAADHGREVGTAIANGPALLGIRAGGEALPRCVALTRHLPLARLVLSGTAGRAGTSPRGVKPVERV
jgi:hypothetical protein